MRWGASSRRCGTARLSAALRPPARSTVVRPTRRVALSVRSDAASPVALLAQAAQTKKVGGEELFEALRVLEKTKEKQVSLDALNGQWQLCFTTGTKKVRASTAPRACAVCEMSIRSGGRSGLTQNSACLILDPKGQPFRSARRESPPFTAQRRAPGEGDEP